MDEMKLKQRKIGTEMDQFMMRVPKSLGLEIRRESRKAGMSLSNFVGTLFEEYFNLKKQEKE